MSKQERTLSSEDIELIANIVDGSMEVKFKDKLGPLSEGMSGLKTTFDGLEDKVDQLHENLEILIGIHDTTLGLIKSLIENQQGRGGS